MRKFLITYLPASMLLAFLAMVLLTCGEGGGGGVSSSEEPQPAPPAPGVTLTGLSISGPSSMPEYGTATYTATASLSDGSTTSVTPTWSVNFPDAEITSEGMLWCHSIGSDQTVTITATYSSETATKDVTIIRVPPIVFTAQELSGKVFFEENVGEGGGYDSHLYILNADFSFEQYSYAYPPDISDYVTGTWSVDVYALDVNIIGQEQIYVQRVGESPTEMEILIYEGPGPPSVVTWERIVPVDGSLMPGTYVNQFGDTWIFNADGTGSTTGDGGWTYTWSVDTGVLKVVFIANDYVGSMWARAGTQSNPTGYTVLKWAFAIHAPTGEFGSYYGGMELTRQGGEPPPGATLTGLSIDGPSWISVDGTATYTATMTMSDGSTSMVTPTWSVNSPLASISPDGVLSCTGIDGDLTVTLTATYSSGGVTETDSMNVTVTNNTWGFRRGPMGLHFEEDIDADGGYHSYLYRFNADSSFERYSYENPPDASDLVTGSWSVDAEGKLILTLPGQGTITVTLLADPFIIAHVLVDDETGTPYNTTWEWTGPGPYPFDESLIPGTYVNQFGDTWIFDADGTGSTTGNGGWTYTWSVDNDGILKVVFPNGYVGSMYERPGSQVSATSYTIIEWAFVLNTPTGDFYFFYGGMRLIRQ